MKTSQPSLGVFCIWLLLFFSVNLGAAEKWSSDEYALFEQVRDTQGIAIDLGAWTGTTSIELSRHFYHVVSVEADRASLGYLLKNLRQSRCKNVTICNHPVAGSGAEVVFGPRGQLLNESTSHIKTESNNPNDYFVRSITFKQLLYDYVYSNNGLNSHKIAFIKCNIEGGEENILEDLLHFAYNNNVKIYISFHMGLWSSHKLENFEYIFKFFNTSCPSGDILQYLRENPSGALLFEPKEDNIQLFKKNITSVIIGYNQLTYIKGMVDQLKKYTSDIVVVDNNSTYEPLLEYYKKDFNFTLLREKTNLGHLVIDKDPFIRKLTGDLFVLTDPDLEFNKNLPDHFVEILCNISNYYSSNKVGFALLIDSDEIRPDITYCGQSIKSWESAFWIDSIHCPLYPNLELYSAPIDTTFCLFNARYTNPSIRIAGDFTCLHLPWLKNFRERLGPGEYEGYIQNNNSTNWFKDY
jgi:FkbM family methyltransferase